MKLIFVQRKLTIDSRTKPPTLVFTPTARWHFILDAFGFFFGLVVLAFGLELVFNITGDNKNVDRRIEIGFGCFVLSVLFVFGGYLLIQWFKVRILTTTVSCFSDKVVLSRAMGKYCWREEILFNTMYQFDTNRLSGGMAWSLDVTYRGGKQYGQLEYALSEKDAELACSRLNELLPIESD